MYRVMSLSGIDYSQLRLFASPDSCSRSTARLFSQRTPKLSRTSHIGGTQSSNFIYSSGKITSCKNCAYRHAVHRHWLFVHRVKRKLSRNDWGTLISTRWRPLAPSLSRQASGEHSEPGEGVFPSFPLRTLLLDNYDSYTYNLYQLIGSVNGAAPLVLRNDEISWEELRKLLLVDHAFDNVVISPGPGTPSRPADIGVCFPLLLEAAEIPILGVCLGHQALGLAHGADIVRAPEPVHGRLSEVEHNGHPLFAGIPSGRGSGFKVVRYHSLAIRPDSVPACLEATAWTVPGHPLTCGNNDNSAKKATRVEALSDSSQEDAPVLMALSHRNRPHHGVQFHPESIATSFGCEILRNFYAMTASHWEERGLPLSSHPHVGAHANGSGTKRSQHQKERGTVQDSVQSNVQCSSDAAQNQARNQAQSLKPLSARDNFSGFTLAQDFQGPGGGPSESGDLLDSGAPGEARARLVWRKIVGAALGAGGSENLFCGLFGQSEGKDTFWLDSATAGEKDRFSFMGGRGGAMWRRIAYTMGHKREGVERKRRLHVHDRNGGVVINTSDMGVLEFLEQELKFWKCSEADTKDLPFKFCGGFVGYIGYELRTECGAQLSRHVSPHPDAALFLADRLVAVDHATGDVFVLALFSDPTTSAPPSSNNGAQQSDVSPGARRGSQLAVDSATTVEAPAGAAESQTGGIPRPSVLQNSNTRMSSNSSGTRGWQHGAAVPDTRREPGSKVLAGTTTSKLLIDEHSATLEHIATAVQSSTFSSSFSSLSSSDGDYFCSTRKSGQSTSPQSRGFCEQENATSQADVAAAAGDDDDVAGTCGADMAVAGGDDNDVVEASKADVAAAGGGDHDVAGAGRAAVAVAGGDDDDVVSAGRADAALSGGEDYDFAGASTADLAVAGGDDDDLAGAAVKKEQIEVKEAAKALGAARGANGAAAAAAAAAAMMGVSRKGAGTGLRNGRGGNVDDDDDDDTSGACCDEIRGAMGEEEHEARAWVKEIARIVEGGDWSGSGVADRRRKRGMGGGSRGRFEPATPRGSYLKDIESCLEAIWAGESYEVCLTTAFERPVPPPDPLSFYLVLRQRNPAPYAAWLNFSMLGGDGPIICCSSPELFLRLDADGVLEARPIKGTVSRGLSPEEDEAMRVALGANEKDRAENLMIVDLLRNDLGRVSKLGSVHVPSLMAVESFATVHQLVSTVRGLKRPEISMVECVRASFPGGSMTGAPKRRTMEILDSVEGSARGVYSGSIGFFSLNQTFELNIVIRTAVIDKNRIRIGAGGAIVALSNPEEEYEEMRLKAKALLAAVDSAECL